jgi:putative Ca2+/H+ antiporter (TMEM165/GDT1 family)
VAADGQFPREDQDSVDAARQGRAAAAVPAGGGASFAVVFAAEWGDITQITTANLAARYADPLSVGVGAVLALWVLAVLAVTTGAKSLEVIPVVWVRRVTAVIMLGLAAWRTWAAAAG